MPIDCQLQLDITVTSGQHLPPPVDVPELEAFPLTVSFDREPATGLVRDRTLSELFLDGISRPANSCCHGHLPEKGRYIREMIPSPARWCSLHGYRYQASS